MIRNGPQTAAFLGPPRTADYRPSLVLPMPLWGSHDATWYSWYDVELMRRDPQCQFGLRILRGPLATVTWEIPASSPEVAAWVDRTLKRIWTRYLNKATAFLEYGSCGGEITWKYDRGSDLIELDELLDIHVLDMRPLEQRRQMVGVRVDNSRGPVGRADLFAPRYWWIANEAEFGAYHGRARLAGAWIPWQEKTARHGARDVRRLWYVKNVMDGGTLYVPPGTTETDIGVYKSNQDYGREMMEKSLAGGVKVFPNITDDKGKRLWEYEAPKINGELTGVHNLMEELDVEILVGMGIPAEVVQAADTGSGWSGRSVPFLVFLTSEDQLADTAVQALDKYVLRPGVAVNFGEDAKYEIKLKSLAKQAEEEEAKKTAQAPQGLPKDEGGEGPEQGQGPQQKPPGPPQGPKKPPGQPQAVRLAVRHAPPGGISIGGKDFAPGEFIPEDVLAGATKEEKTTLRAAQKTAHREKTRQRRAAKKEKGRARHFAGAEKKTARDVQAARTRAEPYPVLHAATAGFGKTLEAVAPLRKVEEAKLVLDPKRVKKSVQGEVWRHAERQAKAFAEAAADALGPKVGKDVARHVGRLAKEFADDFAEMAASSVSDARDQLKKGGGSLRRRNILAALRGTLAHLARPSTLLTAFHDTFGEESTFASDLGDVLREADYPMDVRELYDAPTVEGAVKALRAHGITEVEPPAGQTDVSAFAGKAEEAALVPRRTKAAQALYPELRKAFLSAAPVRLAVQHAPEGEDDSDEQAEMIAEILYGLYGEDALQIASGRAEQLAAAGKGGWQELMHPRGPDGRFIKKGSSEAAAAAREAIGKVLKGGKHGLSVEEVAGHLGLLTVKQLRELHKEHGVKIPGKLRADLVEAVKGRLGAASAAPAEGPESPAEGPEVPAAGPEAPAAPEQEHPWAGDKPPLRLGNRKEVRPPLTLEQANDVRDIYLAATSADQARIRDHLGITAADMQEAFDFFPTALASKQREFYNPLPIEKRIPQARKAQEATKKVAAVGAEIRKDMESLDSQLAEIGLRRGELANKINSLETEVAYAGPRKKKPLQKELDAIRQELQKSTPERDELLAKQEALRARQREAVKDILKVDNPTPVNLSSPWQNLPKEVSTTAKEATDFLGAIAAKGKSGEDLPTQNLNYQDIPSRATYRFFGGNRLNMYRGNSPATYVHELGHAIEYSMPGALVAAQAFLKHRVGDVPSQKLNDALATTAYDDDERGWKDEFDKAFGDQAWYVGKDYGGRSTELISMGVEKLFNDAATFAEKDPEYFAFVVGILNGEVRDNPVPRR